METWIESRFYWLVPLAAAFFTAAVVLSGCASISKNDCESIDWAERGRQDALDAKPATTLMEYQAKCGKHGVQVNEQAYREGFERTTGSLCSFENGLLAGQNGESYPKLCPKESSPDFLRGYNEGKRGYEIEKGSGILLEINNRLNALGRGQKCTEEPECVLYSRCQNGKCKLTGQGCIYDSECTIEGDCDDDSHHCTYDAAKYLKRN